MALYLYKNPKSGIFYLRGSHHGQPVDESTRTRVERDALGVKEKREREIYEQVVLGKKPERTFAEAALGYLKPRTGHPDNPLLVPILQALGDRKLSDITQDVIDDLALELYPADQAADTTRVRKVYTPVSAVMHWAAHAWGLQPRRIKRPTPPPGRLDWRTPQHIEWWLARVGHIKPLITAYVGTGARASEMLALDWADVTPAGHRFTLWEEDTKARKARGVDLQMRVRAVLPPRPASGKGAVWRKPDGDPWHGYDAINTILRRITERETLEAASDSERAEIEENRSLARTVKLIGLERRQQASKRARQLLNEIARREDVPRIHLHVFRHTWATWAYAVTRDLPWVMQQGGWASTDLAMRYIHVGTADLAEDVLAHGWEIRDGLRPRPLALPSPSQDAAG